MSLFPNMTTNAKGGLTFFLHTFNATQKAKPEFIKALILNLGIFCIVKTF